MLYRVFVSRKSRHSWLHQLGFVRLSDEIAEKAPIWIHAVSVGESVASAAVVTELKKLLPRTPVVISTTTETGQEMARKSIKDADAFLFYPLDLIPCVSKALSAVRPALFAGTDTELWPNFRHIAQKRGIMSAMINGTVSDKSLAGARRLSFITKWTLSNVDLFCMQSRTDADRVISLGADSSKVMVTGNCKADQSVNPIGEAQKDELRVRFKFPSDSPVFVAGSTNPGEDAPVIEAFIAARVSHSTLRMIVAPRQIERKDEISELARARGLICGWRSDPASITGREDIVILDTFGELADVYAIADVSFVGGSLIPKGCHSILQPIAQGKPVFFGPYTFKAKDLVAQAKEAGVGFEVADGAALGHGIARLLSDRAALEQIRIGCRANDGG